MLQYQVRYGIQLSLHLRQLFMFMLHRLTVNSKQEVEAAIRKGSDCSCVVITKGVLSVQLQSQSWETLPPMSTVISPLFDQLFSLHSILKLKQTFVYRRYGWSRNAYLASFSLKVLKVTISFCYLSWGERLWVVFEFSLRRYSWNTEILFTHPWRVSGSSMKTFELKVCCNITNSCVLSLALNSLQG